MRGRGVHIVVISFMPVRAECAPLSLHRTLEWSFAPRVPARSRARMRRVTLMVRSVDARAAWFRLQSLLLYVCAAQDQERKG